MSKKASLLFLIICLGSFLLLSFLLVNAQVEQKPVAVIEGPDEIYRCADLTLNGSGSFDPDGGNITDFEWKKGNQVLGTENPLEEGGLGSITAQSHLVHLIITLIVTDDEEDTDSKNKTIDILENKTPVISEVENSDEDNVVTEQEEFSLEVKITSGTDDDSLKYWWDRWYPVGGGLEEDIFEKYFEISDIDIYRTTDNYIITKKSKIKFTPKYGIFNGEDDKKITIPLKVMAEDKCEQSSGKKQIPITIIRNTLPFAEITCSKDPCRVNEGSSFSLNAGNSFSGSYFDYNAELKGTTDPPSSNPDTIEKYEWTWTFTDKNTGEKTFGSKTETDPDLSLKFNDSGNAVVNLKITDSHQNTLPKEPFTDGSSYTNEQKQDVITDRIEIEILETQDDPPIADASATKIYTKIHQNFILNGSDSSDDRGIVLYKWKIVHSNGTKNYETSSMTQTHQFGWLGNYTITLTVRDTHSWPYQEDSAPPITVTVFSSEEELPEDPPPGNGEPPPTTECGLRGCERGETAQNCPEDCAQCDYVGRTCSKDQICQNRRCITPLAPLDPFVGTYIANGKTVTYGGLVPCGKEVIVDGVAQNIPCQFCHFFVMFKGVVDFLLIYIIFPLAALLLVIGGIMFVTAAESPGRIETAKKLITSTFTGLIIIFSAWLVINLFFSVIGISDFAGGFTGPSKWFIIDCPIQL